jgi:hypothetical protein
MTQILAVFKGRSQALECMYKLQRSGVKAAIVTTPKEAGVGCGLSVKFDSALMGRARQIVLSSPAFYTFLRYEDRGGRLNITPFR